MKSLVVVGLCFVVFLLVPSTQVAGAAAYSAHGRFAYHWPIKPFERQHAVRGGFGDPRIVSDEQPFGWTGPDQPGAHSFHNGIDIVAPPGTPVYPVVSGRVVRAKPGQIVVHTEDGRSFQYYHLSGARAVRVGKTVVGRHTVLGWIRVKWAHVHLAEIDGAVVHNPLDRGHLEPYRDWRKPVATDLYVNDGPVASPLDGRSIGRGDRLAVSAAEPQPMPVAGPWSGLPQAPALVEWRLLHGQAWTPWNVAVDFRHTEPPPRYFWEVYGVGTYQNSPAFANRIYLGTPGRYLFRLRIHPERLHSGSYQIAVRVADISGNRSTTRWPLQIVR
jgi:peptidase M23-like protein